MNHIQVSEIRCRDPEKGNRRRLTLILAIVALGTFLRVDGVVRKSLWVDEVSTANRVSKPWKEMIGDLTYSPFPPLYYITLWGWVRIWGISDFSIRLLSVVVGVVAPPLVYVLWRPIVGRGAARWTLVLSALSAYHIQLSQDAKMYGLVWIFSAVSCGSFLRALWTSPRSTVFLAAYCATTSCLILTSYVGIASFAVQGLYCLGLLLLRPACRRNVALMLVAMWIAVQPSFLWASSTMRAVTQRIGVAWIPPASLTRAPRDIYRLIGSFLVGYQVELSQSSLALTDVAGNTLAILYHPCILLAVGLLIWIAYYWGRQTCGCRGGDNSHAAHDSRQANSMQRSILAFMALWFWVPCFGALVYSLCFYSLWGIPRYMVASAPSLIVWLSLALDRTPNRRLANVMGAVLLGGNLAMVAFDRTHCTRTPWRRLAAVVSDLADKDARNRVVLGADQHQNAGASDDLIIAWIDGSKFEENCLTYALGQQAPGMGQIDVLALQDAFSFRKPFAVVPDIFLADHDPDAVGHELVNLANANGYACHQRFRQTVFQEPYTAMPTPVPTYSTEVWWCTPIAFESSPTQ
jgi:hypothetical protein